MCLIFLRSLLSVSNPMQGTFLKQPWFRRMPYACWKSYDSQVTTPSLVYRPDHGIKLQDHNSRVSLVFGVEKSSSNSPDVSKYPRTKPMRLFETLPTLLYRSVWYHASPCPCPQTSQTPSQLRSAVGVQWVFNVLC